VTVQEAIRQGWVSSEYLVYVWQWIRMDPMTLAQKRLWLQDWGSLTRTQVPAWLLTDAALMPRKEG